MLAARFPDFGIGMLGVSLAFGLTVLTMAFAIGHISGCHLNPAVSLGLWAGGRFKAKICSPTSFSRYWAESPRVACSSSSPAERRVSMCPPGSPRTVTAPTHREGYTLLAALVTEVVMTMMFLVVILGATDERAPKGLAPIAIGLCLTLIHLIGIPVTNTSVNPARSTGVALFVEGWAVEQLWLFWAAPIVGAVLGALIYRFIGGSKGRK